MEPRNIKEYIESLPENQQKLIKNSIDVIIRIADLVGEKNWILAIAYIGKTMYNKLEDN